MSAIINLRPGNSKAAIRIDSNTTIQMANLAASNSESISDATISRLYWTTNGSITIARGANTIVTLFGSGHWDLHGISLTEYSSANLVFTVTGAGTLLCEVSKQSNLHSVY